MKKKKNLVISLLLFALSNLLFSGLKQKVEAATLPSDTLPLKAVLENITRTHPEILEAERKYYSTLGERSIASSSYMPMLGTELSVGQEITDGVAVNDKRKNLSVGTATVYARQNLYNGGKTKSFVNETDARILAAAHEVLNVANRVYLETTIAYLNVLKSRDILDLSRKNVLTQEKILKHVREKAESGFTRISDLKNSEARLALAQSNYLSRQQDLNHALVTFHRQFGRFIEKEAFVRPEPSHNLPKGIETAVDLAFHSHPALEVAKYNIQVRKFSFEKTKAAYLPIIDLELKAQHRSNTGGEKGTTDLASAILTFKYTFFDGGHRKGEKIQNYELLRKENQRSYVERRNVNESVRLAWTVMQAEANKQKHLTDYVAKSAKTLEAFTEEYHIGRRTLLDLLNMENEYNDAMIAKTESDFSYLRAWYQAAQATGLLVQEHAIALMKKMGIPSQTQYDLNGYEELLNDRDIDSVTDLFDQCDNSLPDTPCLPSGCRGENAIAEDYELPENQPPYILPEEQTTKTQQLQIDKNRIIELKDIRFNKNTADLSDGSRKRLSFVAEQLKGSTEFNIHIIGHTDSTGNDAYNMRLSRERAKSVYDALIVFGVNKNVLSWTGKGETSPVATNGTKEGRQKNRRVMLKLAQRTNE